MPRSYARPRAGQPAALETLAWAGPGATIRRPDQEAAMQFREIVDTIAQACGWTVSGDPSGAIYIEVPTGSDRTQMVMITSDVDVADQAIVRYWSVIGPAEGLDLERCLEENARLCYGAFALKDQQLVMMDTQLVQDADPMEVGASIGNLAAYADRYEQDLFGTDDN